MFSASRYLRVALLVICISYWTMDAPSSSGHILYSPGNPSLVILRDPRHNNMLENLLGASEARKLGRSRFGALSESDWRSIWAPGRIRNCTVTDLRSATEGEGGSRVWTTAPTGTDQRQNGE